MDATPRSTATTFDPARAEGAGLADTARHLRTAIQLGWKVEANWTDPTLFVIYSVVKPIASLLLIYAMVAIVGSTTDEAAKTFVIVGSSLWAMLVAGITGPAWTILDDRERYRMLKYVAVSPATMLVTIVGRGMARLAVGAMGTVIAFLFAIVALGLRVDPAEVVWPLLAGSLVLGVMPIIGFGLLIGGVCLQTRQESWSYPEAFAGAMFLVSGVVFPLSVLPAPLQVVGLANPVTWWVEGVRTALVPDLPTSIGGAGSVWTSVTGSAAPDAPTILAALFVTGALVTLGATAIFRSSERRARDLGLLDRTTGS